MRFSGNPLASSPVRAAKYFSALGVNNFVKRISLIKYGKDALCAASDDIIALAEAEGLEAHANAVRVRMKGLKL